MVHFIYITSIQIMRSQSNWCCSLSKWMSVSSSHLDSSSPHISSQSNSLSIEVYWAQGGSVQTVTTTFKGSYTLTGLAPATTYTEWTHKPNLDMGLSAVLPLPQHTMVRHPLMDAWSQGDCDTLQCIIMSQSLFQVKTCIPVY